LTGPITAASAAFTDIYMQDLWGLSRMEPVEDRLTSYADIISGFIRSNRITSVAEFGCGFWTYAALIDWRGVTYDGYDVFSGVIEKNIRDHSAPNIRFHTLTDSTRPAPVDLIICKDVFQHLPNEDVQHLLTLFKATARISLIINDVVPDANTNGAAERGGYRAIRLDQPPFNEACETLHEWESIDFGVDCRKRAVILRAAAP
jgi:SAM-dependent methyltransferase